MARQVPVGCQGGGSSAWVSFPFVIGIGGGEHLGEGGEVDLLAGVVAGGPTVEVENTRRRWWERIWAGR